MMLDLTFMHTIVNVNAKVNVLLESLWVFVNRGVGNNILDRRLEFSVKGVNFCLLALVDMNEQFEIMCRVACNRSHLG